MNGEILIAKVYNAVRQSDIWNKCLLIVTYDEHGGFYDHKVPERTVPPDNQTQELLSTFMVRESRRCSISPRAREALLTPFSIIRAS